MTEALVNFEATRDIWQEGLDSVREIKAGRGKRTKVEAKLDIVRERCATQLYSASYAVLLLDNEAVYRKLDRLQSIEKQGGMNQYVR